ncbi:MAG: ABC transporter permease [Candidatus Izimaplasma sp.]|nr:ABC transporter permease [Candidatus Izimaplasma bacterium]
MLKYILIRILLAIFTLFIIISVIFIGLKYASISKWSRNLTNDQMLRLTYLTYKNYLYRLFVLHDWGETKLYPLPVWEIVTSKIRVTLFINVFAYLNYAFWGFFFGITSAIYSGKLYDKIVSFFTLIFGSIPIYISILALIFILGYKFHLLDPIHTQVGPGFVEQVKGLIIPVTALSLTPISRLTRLIRSELVESMNADYLLLAKSKGLNKAQRIKRHILKHIMIVVLPVLTNTFIKVLGLSFLVEIVYNVAGIANLLYDAILQSYSGGNVVYYDINIIVLIGFLYSAVGILVGLFNDISQMLLDPRVKLGSRRTT